MKRLLLSLAGWLTFGAAIWLLSGSLGAWTYAALPVLPGLGAVLLIYSKGSSAENRVARVAWWTITLACCFFLTLLSLGHWEWQRSLFQADKQTLFTVSATITMLAIFGAAYKRRAFPDRRTATDLALAVVVLAVALGNIVWRQDRKAKEYAKKARDRWEEIGRPLEELDRKLTATPANQSLATLGEILKEQVNSEIYKVTAGNGTAPKIPQEAIELFNRELPKSDELPPFGKPTTELDARAPQLDAAYQRILAGESPVWAANPRDFWRMQVPNFLGMRMMTQLIVGDAYRRMEHGDLEGAKVAVNSAHHLSANLSENPTLVSLMIHVAIDALLAKAEVRLPADPAAFEKLAADVHRFPAAMQRVIQLESLGLANPDRILDEQIDDAGSTEGPFPMPKWARRLTSRLTFDRYCQMSALANAESVAILQNPEISSLTDLGVKQLEKVEESASLFNVSVSRAHQRLYGTLLLREQVALLRMAREKLAQGQPLESRESIVLPGRNWKFTAKTENNSVALQLDPLPDWLKHSNVLPDDFWILPLDGSQTWLFRQPARSGAR